MTTTTYCVRADMVSIVGEAFITAATDDDQVGIGDDDQVTDAIERAANKMNAALGKQYIISELSGNDWCKWCNAHMAIVELCRRGNSPPPFVLEEVQGYKDNLSDAAWGRFQVPEQAPSADHRATVSNFRVEIGKLVMPIRVSTEESTGAAPQTGRNIMREESNQPGWW